MPGDGLTALRFDDAGLHAAVGTSGGRVALFDLRSSRPLLVKDHMYGAPIVDIKFHSPHREAGGLSGRKVISADRHIVRVWDADSGKGFTSVQPAEPGINDVLVWPDSGLMMLGMDAPRIQAYFVPALGPAPRWCSFLEGLTEELEESAQPALYDDYRFVTRAELDRVGLGHMVGTPLLRAFMHGFFLHNRLWHKALALARPFDYDDYRTQRVAAKLEAERQSRITVVKKLPKVNAQLAAKLLAAREGARGEPVEAAAAASSDEEEADEGGDSGRVRKRRRAAASSALLEDERFGAMFTDRAFAIDERSEEYKLLHPNADANKRDKQLLREHFEELEGDSDVEGSGDEGGDDEAGDSDDGARPRHAGGAGTRRADRGGDGSGGVRMYAARDGAAAAAFRARQSRAPDLSLPLELRAAGAGAGAGAGAADGTGASQRLGGGREVTFTPRAGGRGRGRDGGRRGRSGRGDRDSVLNM
ncbi:hypothetical protein WJX81_001159 [Elliptochloris bilobata]|uniref:NUC153 domain-containing protein n=1 Tax=Elliptochloris bilobata TaxID=381761 RepID=A0AAW1SJS4_9CHLO